MEESGRRTKLIQVGVLNLYMEESSKSTELIQEDSGRSTKLIRGGVW